MELNRFIPAVGRTHLEAEIRKLNADGYTVIQIIPNPINPPSVDILAAIIHDDPVNVLANIKLGLPT